MAQFNPQKFMESCVARAYKRPTIGPNDRGEHVRDWQVFLQRALHAPSMRVDGVFTRETQLATMTVQRGLKLPPDGVVGPKTWTGAALAACYAAAVTEQARLASLPAAASAVARAASSKLAAAQQARVAAHGLGALDFSFSVVDPKSVMLGAVLGLGLGAVLFRRK